VVARVLIADDNPDLVAILSTRFRALGFDVVEAANGARALEEAKKQAPDIMVLDVMMPELNGFQVCRKLKENNALKHIPVVLLTAKSAEADKFWGHEVGATLYLTKPVDPGVVVHQVQTILGKK
jgi:DNA-binding response OmpR family regulator